MFTQVATDFHRCARSNCEGGVHEKCTSEPSDKATTSRVSDRLRKYLRRQSFLKRQKRVTLLPLYLFTLWACFGWADASSVPFVKDGQNGWQHDEGLTGGYFHTYDGFVQRGTGRLPRKLHIFLPKDYESLDAQDKRYPVLYFNDGQSVFFGGGAENRSLHLGQVLSRLYEQNLLEELIVVALYPHDRSYEYSHVAPPGRPCCGIGDYTSEVADTIKTFVDRNYRTRADRRNTLIAGSSRGGLAAFLMATGRPEVFGNLLSQSGSFWYGLDVAGKEPFTEALADSALLRMSEAAFVLPNLRPRIFMDWGLRTDGGIHNSFIEARAAVRGRELSDILRSRFAYQDSELRVVEDPRGGHDEDSWTGRISEALIWFFPRADD